MGGQEKPEKKKQCLKRAKREKNIETSKEKRSRGAPDRMHRSATCRVETYIYYKGFGLDSPLRTTSNPYAVVNEKSEKGRTITYVAL